MLQNLKGIYARTEAYEKLLRIFDLIVSTGSAEVQEYKQRAAIHMRLRHLRAARSDLETYLAGAPGAADRPDVVQQIEAINRYLAALN
jgi:regulator of sirC expression with transglutaminase-like and TPR domain